MFGRRQNRKRRTIGERLKRFWERTSRLFRRSGPYLVLLAVAVTVPWLVVETYRWGRSTSYFSVSSIRVQGLEQTERRRLTEVLEQLRGRNLFDLPTERARRHLASHPWIDQVALRTDPPNRLVVDVREHDPVALLADRHLALVDGDGTVFKRLDGNDSLKQFRDLPLINGLSPDELQTEHGRRLFEEALDVVEAYDEMGLAEERPLSNVHVDHVLGVTLFTERPGTEIRLGRRRHESRLERLKVVRRRLDDESLDPAYILLDQPSPLERAVVGPRSSQRGEEAGPRRHAEHVEESTGEME